MDIARALREIIRKEKRSIGRVAKGIGFDRSSLYRTLKDDGNPEKKTIEKILDFLGYDIRFVKLKRREVKPISDPSRSRRNKKRRVI